MKKLIGVTVLLAMLSVAGVALADGLHRTSGVIVAADRDIVTIRLESGASLALSLAASTAVYDGVGQPMRAAALGPGDYVREECVEREGGRHVAVRITLLRPAWRDLGPPEN